MKSISKKIIVGTVAASLVLGSGVVGLLHSTAFANTVGTSTPLMTPSQVTNTENDKEVAGSAEQQDQEVADDAAGQDQEVADDVEQANLQKQATITKEQSAAIAIGQVQGNVKDVQLEDENGVVVYNVQIQDSKGLLFEVKVDAKTGKITKQEQDNAEQNGQDDTETNDD
ncbi:PepSY domain-containing protein [Paenibacillus alginolyticus]|uniref:PepSY domain-containing protein n=1 Tax=Paenibacillus alginolyticus TaxID=59839 RepID=A0ABT4GMV6_9BACL|nr:PepSY domain-containing protein [Paenibacillus alginolyticus]MCY9697534.1 PepSY domain-containing protein [Paenibacillus alginolyticus]MEC0142000.1 PepSY domain-containing protein [Paenibacillus alginolyticus]